MRVQSVQINLSPSSQAEAAQIFSGLKSGDTIHAELTGVSGSRIQITTQDGKTVKADFRGNAQFLPGDKLELMLDARQGNRISLRLISLNSQPVRLDVNAQENLLLRSGIEPSGLNVRLSGILQENGFLPTAQNISNLARITQEQPNLPADLSAFLAANNLKPDEATLGHLNQLLSQSPQTGNRVQQLSNAFAKLLAEFEAATGQKIANNTTAGASSESVSKTNGFASADAIAKENTLSGTRTGTNILAPADLEQLFRALASLPGQDDSSAGIKGKLSEQNTSLSGQQVKTTSVGVQFNAGGLEEIFRLLASLPEQEAKAALTTLAGKDAQNAKIFSSVLSFLNLPVQERQSLLSALPNLPQGNLGWITGTSSMSRTDMSPDTPVSVKNIGSSESGVQMQSENATETLPNTVQSRPADAALQAAGQLLRKLDGLFLQINPGDIKSTAEELSRSIQSQETLTENIGADLARLAGDKSILSRQAGELHAQVQFTSGLEQFFYFQLPVRFENQKSTAELYVFERNSKAKSNRELSTILIALETQNLGRVETMLRCEGTSLDISFRLNTESFSNYLKDKASDLKQALAESGFQIKNLQFGLIQTKTTLLNAQELFSKENHFPAVGLDIQI